MIDPYYSDDRITIYHGDSFEILHELSGVGAIVTDPPYSSGGAFRGDRAQSTTMKYVNSDTAAYRPEFAGDTRDQRSFIAWSTLWLNAARNASTPGSVLVSFIDWRNLPALSDAIQAGGWTWRNMATWWKPGVRMQKGRFSSSAEYLLYGTNGPVLDGAASPQNVFKCRIDVEREHIAQKRGWNCREVLGAGLFHDGGFRHDSRGSDHSRPQGRHLRAGEHSTPLPLPFTPPGGVDAAGNHSGEW